MASLSGAPQLGKGGGSRGASGGSGLQSSLPKPDVSKKKSAADSMSHLDDLFDDPPSSKKSSDKKGSGKKGKKSSETKSKPQKSILDSSTDEEMFPKAKGAFGRGGSSIFDRSQSMPVAPPSDSEDSPTAAAAPSNLRARRGLTSLSSSEEGPAALRTTSGGAGGGGGNFAGAPPSPLDAGERLMSFLQDDVGEVLGGAGLGDSSDLDVFGTGSKKGGGSGAGGGGGGAGGRGRRPTAPVQSSDPLAGFSDSDGDEPITREAPARGGPAAADDDFLDLDAPESPPKASPRGQTAASSTAGPKRSLRKEDSDEWALDLDILPEGGGGGGGSSAAAAASGPPPAAVAPASSPAPAPAAAGYTPSGATARAGRRAATSSASLLGAPSGSHQPASAAARSRLAEEAKRQMELDLESSGEIEVPGLRSGPPPPISTSAAAAVTTRNSPGRRSTFNTNSPPITPPADGSPNHSPKDAGFSPGRRMSTSGASDLRGQFLKEKEALRAEHRLAIEGLQDEVRRLATQLAEAKTGGGDPRRTSDLEAQLLELRAKQEVDLERHIQELQTLRAAGADNDANVSKISALEREKEAMQRNLEHKDTQLRELDVVQAQLREKDYKLHEATKALDLAKAEHSAALSSTSSSLQAEVASLKRQVEDVKREAAADQSATRDEANREATRKVDEVRREVEHLKAELEASVKRTALEAATAEARGRRDAEDERDRAIRELKARESALEEEREVVQRHAVSAQVLSDLSNKVDDVAAKAIEREDRVARSIDRNLQERETVLSSREADIALREESLGAREREAEMLRRQLQTILAALEKTSVEEKQDLLVEKQRLHREQSRLDALTGTLQGERADLRMQVETEQGALAAAREARISDRETLVRELCEERRRVAEERIASANAADLARTEEHSARRRCFEYEARANAALSMAKEQEERAEASAGALEAERRAVHDARAALEKEKAAIHEEAAQLTALGLQIQGRSAELRTMQEEVEKQQRLADEKNASLVAERAGIQAKEHGISMEKKRLAEQRRAGEAERLRIATERKALASDRVAASKATEAARDVQAKLSMVVRAWAAEGISIPVDWEALNFSPSALSEGALQSIRMKVASESRLGAAKLKANHSQRAAARGPRGPRGGAQVSEAVRKQQEFLEQLKRQESGVQELVKSSPHRPQVYGQPISFAVSAAGGGPLQQQQQQPSLFAQQQQQQQQGGLGFAPQQQQQQQHQGGGGPARSPVPEMPSPNLTSMVQLSSSSASSGGGGRSRGSRLQPGHHQSQQPGAAMSTPQGGLTPLSPLDPSSASSGNGGTTSGAEEDAAARPLGAGRGAPRGAEAEPEGRDSSVGVLQDIDEAEEW